MFAAFSGVRSTNKSSSPSGGGGGGHQQPPVVGGILHAACVLDDRLLVNQNAASLERAWAPKARGGFNAHVALSSEADAFFVLFSSSSALGNVG